MGDTEKTREQLTQELAQAQKRIAEFEAMLPDKEKPAVDYDTIRTFFDSATDSFSIWDSNLNLVYINDATLKYHPAGTRKSDVIGKNIKDLIPHCEESGRYEKYKRVLDTGEPLIIDDFKADPKYGDICLSIKVFKIGDGIGIISSDTTERQRMEQELRDSRQRLNVLIENAPDIIFSYDFNGVFTCGNKKVRDMLGYDANELVGKNMAESGLLSEKGILTAMAKVEENRRGITTGPDEYELITKNGSHVFIEASGVPLVIGGWEEVLCVAHDITERKKMEEALRQSEEKLRAVFDSISDSITVIDVNGNITDLNDAAVELFVCKSKEDVLGMNGLTFIAEEDQPSAAAKFEEGSPARFMQCKFRRTDGSTFWGETSSDALRDKSGAITGFIGIVRDITERRKTEEALRHSEEKFRVIFNSIADGISVIDLTTGKIIDTNKAALHMFNFTREDVIGMNAQELVAEKDRQRAMEDMVNTLQTGDSGLAEWRLLGKGGTEHACEARASVIRDSSWNPLYLVNVMRDRTEQKKLEEKLRQSEEKLRRIFDSIDDGVSVTDIEGTVLDVNEKALELSGYSREEFIGKFGLELLAERDRARAVQDMMNTFNTGRSGLKEYTSLTKDGREFPAEARSTALYDSLGRPVGLVSVLRDITERKQMEDKLKRSEERIRQVFNSVGVGITVTDMEGKVIDINDFGLQLGGYSKEELLGSNGIRVIVERDRPRIVTEMIEALQTGRSSIQEFTALENDGSEYEVEAIATVLSDSSGKPTGLIISITDITERKRIEKELNDYKENLERIVQARTADLAAAYKELQNSEARLRTSEEKLRTMFMSMADGVVVTNLEGNIEDLNDAQIRLFGYDKKEEVLGLNGFDFIAERDRDLAMNDMSQLFSEGFVTGRSWTFKHSSGGEFKAELSTALLKNAKGNPTYILVVMRDITERKRIEETLRESEEWHRALVETSGRAGLGIAIIQNVEDRMAALVFANDESCKISGYSREELLNMSVGDLIPPDVIEQIIRSYTERQQGDSIPHTYETVFVRKDRTRIPVMVSVDLMHMQGKPATVAFFRDITERKRMEEALRKSEEKLRTMFSSMADGVIVIGLDGKVKDINEALLHLFEHDSKEAALNTDIFSNFISEEARESALKDMRYLLTERIPEARVFRFASQKGRELIAEIHTSLLLDASGNPTDIMCVVRDITERKRMEETLRVSEEKLRAIYNSIGDGITVTDLKGNILDLNEAGLRFSGYGDKEEAIGRNGLLFISETDRDRARNDMFNVLQKGIGITTEYRLVDKEGKEFDAEVSGAMISDADGKPSAIVNVVRDITERKHIEQALVESEAKYRTLVEQSEQGICVLQNGRVVFANNGLARINGYSLKELYAMSPDELLQTIHPDDREAFVERVKRRLRGEKMMPRHEYKIVRKDGVERQLETFTKRITYKGQTAIQSTIEDVTERKKSEAQLKKSKEELRSYLNQITKAQEEERKKIARELHDDTIQELITLSRQIDDLIDKQIKPNEDRRGSRKKIEAARKKVDTILQGVRRFTRDLRPSVLDDLGLIPALEWLTTDMSKRFEVPANISIVGSERPTSPEAALAIFRVAQESIRNAGQHSKASQIQLNLKFTARTVTLSVIDDGVGFTPPKQTSDLTKVGKLGVAGMYERAQLIEATLSIKSRRNKGTTVTLEVPIK